MKYFIFIIIIINFLFGCSINLIKYYDTINDYSIQKNYKKIDNFIKKNKNKIYGTNSFLLYYFDKGYFLHLDGKYEESNKYFSLAKELFDDYYTKSITNKISTLFINDKIEPYYGTDFEICMLYSFKILNYLLMNDYKNAEIEVKASINFFKTIRNNNFSKNIYQDDAFLNYLQGIVFEINIHYNDAFISYKNALNLYGNKYYKISPPQELFNNTIFMAKKLNLKQEIEELNKKYPELAKNYIEPIRNEIIILHYNGLVPKKISKTFEISFWEAWANVNYYNSNSIDAVNIEKASKIVNSIASDEQISVAFPSLIETQYNVDYSELYTNDQKFISKKIINLGDIIKETFNDKKTQIYAKCLARAAIKFSLVKIMNKKIKDNINDSLLSFALRATIKTTASLTEDADKRSWRTLPNEIFMTRIPNKLDENFNIKVSLFTKNNFKKDYEMSIENVIIEKDNKIKYNNFYKKFIIFQTNE